jgi:hypothetical protein
MLPADAVWVAETVWDADGDSNMLEKSCSRLSAARDM